MGQIDCRRIHRFSSNEISFINSDSGSIDAHKKQGERASSIAQKAAQEAKAASDAQNIAGQQAAHQLQYGADTTQLQDMKNLTFPCMLHNVKVKAQLAEKAVQAAKAAEAALSGKEAIVEQLKGEVKEAESVVREEGVSLQQTQSNVKSAMEAAQQSRIQLKTLASAVRTANANLGNAEAAAQGARQAYSEKQQLLDAAKRRVDELSKQLQAAKIDLANTKQAALKASAAAHDAKANANRNRRRIANWKSWRSRRRYG
ncbi:uncharacterized protein LOC124309493 [Neodiprion virginianus]|uniref:uncharacterized protein LOC124309493 n=1 Tax=Neodiprion virginianus TaxID=2961670 RepID=UPI001EE6A2A1|nr:uncharacterized protein LOC124309493 [Neodiprion virginianus]